MDYCLKQKIYIIIIKNNRDYHDTTACVANSTVMCLTATKVIVKYCFMVRTD